MPVQPINNQQNNLYALNSAIVAGTAGAYAGYAAAPRAAKNMTELLNSKPDIFERTMQNIAEEGGRVYSDALDSIYAARMIKESPEEIANSFFEDNKYENGKLNVNKIKGKKGNIVKKQKVLDKNLTEILETLEDKKGQKMTVKEAIEISVPEKMREKVLQNYTEIFSEDTLKESIEINDKFIDEVKAKKNLFMEDIKEQISILDETMKKQKDGFVTKQDLISVIKVKTDKLAQEVANSAKFERFKKFVPRVERGKWAGIIGGSAALITALGVKLFKSDNL